jgi:hypothetical protein
MPEVVASASGAQETAQEPSGGNAAQDLGESTNGIQKQSVTSESNGEQSPEKKPSLSRYERTKRHRAEIAQREAVLRTREEQFAQRERANLEQQKPKRDYTIQDLRKYRGQWAKEAAQGIWRDDYDPAELVEKADAEIKAIEEEEKASKSIVELPHAGTPAHEQQWRQAEAELAQADKEFMRSGTRLDSRLREIMGSEDGNIYRQHPRGIVAAYHRAKMELLEADYKDLQTKFQQIEQENKRLNGLTSVGGGAPGRVGSGQRVESINDFAKLSSADMLKHLKSGARRGSGGTPWF